LLSREISFDLSLSVQVPVGLPCIVSLCFCNGAY